MTLGIDININVGGSLDIGGVLDVVLHPPPRNEIIPLITTTINGISITARGTHMAYVLPDDKQIPLLASYVDAHNNPAQVDGVPVWGTSDGTIATITPDADNPFLAMLAPGPDGTLGNAQVTATADADRGDGVSPVVLTLDVTIVAGTAVGGTLTPQGDQQPLPTP